MKTLATLLIFGSFFLSGCDSEARIDGSSQEAFEASMTKVAADVSEEDKGAFAQGMILLSMEGGMLGDALAGKDADASMRKALDGKTASDIIAEGKKVAAPK